MPSSDISGHRRSGGAGGPARQWKAFATTCRSHADRNAEVGLSRSFELLSKTSLHQSQCTPLPLGTLSLRVLGELWVVDILGILRQENIPNELLSPEGTILAV